MVNYFKNQEIAGLEVLGVIGEDGAGGVPTLEYCMDYANSAGFPPERLLIDANWSTTFEHIANGGAGGLALPWDGVLDARSMTYLYNSAQSADSPFDIVSELLANTSP